MKIKVRWSYTQGEWQVWSMARCEWTPATRCPNSYTLNEVQGYYLNFGRLVQDCTVLPV